MNDVPRWPLLIIWVLLFLVVAWLHGTSTAWGQFEPAPTPEFLQPPYIDEACQADFACQGRIVFELVYAGVVLKHPLGDLTAEECTKAKADIQIATQAMSELICRPRIVKRQDS